ncbi:MAG: alkaline phosphatase family protein [Tepidiformaceae bacterium]
MPNRRVLMVALDGLDISVLRDAFAAGRMPNLKAFVESSLESAVNSLGEQIEGSVWPTFATGMGPGIHGHHWFTQWIAEDAAFVPASDPRLSLEPFWGEALNAGRRVTLFDIAYALPIGHANERAYTGWGLQDEMAENAHPATFGKAIRKRHGRSHVRKDTQLVRTPHDRLRLARQLRMGSRQRGEVLQGLVEARDWDLLIFGFGEFHLGGHHLSAPMQLSPKVSSEAAMLAILEPLDRAWPAIVAAAGDDCDIALFAVHGMQHRVPYGEAAQRIVQAMEGKPPPGPARQDFVRRLRNLLPEGLHQAIWLRLPASVRIQRVAQAWLNRIDIHRDPVFVLEADCAVPLRLNMEGRERFGVVARDDGRALLAAVERESQRYRTEDGLQPFGDLILSEEVFNGPRVHRLPDGTLLFNPHVLRTRRLTRDDGFEVVLQNPESRNGVHTGRGFCFYRPAAGAPPQLLREEVDNLDFAPTILERLGVTPTAHYEGTPFLA